MMRNAVIVLFICIGAVSLSAGKVSGNDTVRYAVTHTESEAVFHPLPPGLRCRPEMHGAAGVWLERARFMSHTDFYAFRRGRKVSGGDDGVDTVKGVRWALRTNLLVDAAAVPSLGAEVYVGKNFSVQAGWMYAWWSHRAGNFFWRIYGGDVGVRWWFGRGRDATPLSGHHIGVYFQTLIWDFECGGRGYMGGSPGRTLWERANMGGGVEYGYSLPVSRRLSLDFSIGIGYLGGSYREYEPECGFYVWKATKRLNYFGPTKAEVALVYRF